MGPVSPNVKYIYYFLQNIAPFNFFFFLKEKKILEVVTKFRFTFLAMTVFIIIDS